MAVFRLKDLPDCARCGSRPKRVESRVICSNASCNSRRFANELSWRTSQLLVQRLKKRSEEQLNA